MEGVEIQMRCVYRGVISLIVLFFCFSSVGLAETASLQAQGSGATGLSERASRGKEIFQDYCFLCHDRATERVKPLGPSLNGLFKRERLIVGKPVNEANVTEVIKTGPTPGMPAFRYALTEQQIGDLVEFLKTK
jgi:mono/diheme cytochrome c family protein